MKTTNSPASNFFLMVISWRVHLKDQEVGILPLPLSFPCLPARPDEDAFLEGELRWRGTVGLRCADAGPVGGRGW